MADTLQSMVGQLRLYCPQLPYFLGAKFIRDRYRAVMDQKTWSGLRAETMLLPSAMKTAGTVAVTRGQTLVTGSGTAWASTDVGRQFMLGARAPVYTIVSIDVGLQTLVLDQPLAGTTAAAATYQILDAYVTLPVDFKQFIVVLDPDRAWQLRFWVSQAELASYDAQRTTVGDPRLLADLKRHATTGAPMFELWPYATTDRNYVVRYVRKAPDLELPTDEPLLPIGGDTLVTGALADVARWPGTPERPNLMFGKSLDTVYERLFVDAVDATMVEDENLNLTWLASADEAQWPHAPLDARWMQSHAVYMR